jgi:lipoprotein-releasing system permease protein
MSKLFQPLVASIGLRYTQSRRKSNFISFISLASMIGIAIGVLVLITVLSVMNGFESAMRDRILGMLAHVTVSENDAVVDDWKTMMDDLKRYPHIKAMAPFIEKPVMLNHGDEARGVMLQGILPDYESQVADVFKHVKKGDASTLTAGSHNIMIGSKLAEDLKVDVGDSVTLISPSADALETGELPSLERFKVSAIFRIDMQNYDAAFVYIHQADAQEIFKMGESVTGVRLKLDDVYEAPNLDAELMARMGLNYPDLWVNNWTRQNENFFKAIQMQKSVMFIILLLITAVAAFNLVSTLVMVVTDKESDIAILRTLGMAPSKIMQIFMVQGTLIGLIGTLVGLVLGILLASHLGTIVGWLEVLFDTHFISGDVYFISELESRVNPRDVILITSASIILSLLATIYPAWRASKVQPAEALRYE